MAGVINGKLVRVSVGGVDIRCQTAGTLTVDKGITTNTPCKEDEGWSTSSVGDKTWEMTVDAKNFLDDIELNQLDLLQQMIDSDEPVEVEWQTTSAVHSFPENAVVSGSAFIGNLAWDAPADGESTTSYTFNGTGPLTLVRSPNVT